MINSILISPKVLRELFEGLELRFLYVLRLSKTPDLLPEQEHNKVNFNQFNVILNYNF